MFQQYWTTSKKLMKYVDFDNVPEKPAEKDRFGNTIEQTFTSFCYMENDQLICCSNFGDVMVVDGIAVTQIIDRAEFIEPGTVPGDRLNFKRVVPCRFGFATFTNNIIYFFEFVEPP